MKHFEVREPQRRNSPTNLVDASGKDSYFCEDSPVAYLVFD